MIRKLHRNFLSILGAEENKVECGGLWIGKCLPSGRGGMTNVSNVEGAIRRIPTLERVSVTLDSNYPQPVSFPVCGWGFWGAARRLGGLWSDSTDQSAKIKTKMKQRPCLRLTTLLFYARR